VASGRLGAGTLVALVGSSRLPRATLGRCATRAPAGMRNRHGTGGLGMRQDICRTLDSQLLRPTFIGQPESFSAAEINDAVRRWSQRRGLEEMDRSWFDFAKKKSTKRVRNPEVVERSREVQRVKARSRDEAFAAEVLANPSAYTALQVARVRIEHARRTGGQAAARAEQARLRDEAIVRAEAKRKAKRDAGMAARLAKLDSLNTMSRVRTLIEHARRTGGEAAVLEARKQFAAERLARKAASQRERRARNKQKKQK
jgi:hypothetical protein